MKVLVTGSSGFIGKNMVPFLAKRGMDICCLDRLPPDFSWRYHENHITYTLGSYASDVDFSDVNVVVNLASESHVDRSISGPRDFIDRNVNGTLELFEICRKIPRLEKIIQFSTDEVGACLEDGSFYEKSEFNCGSVYSATKGAQELLSQAYLKTFDLPIVITRCVNVFGPHQWDEKFIPTICRNAIKGEKIPIYGSGMQSRQWIHVDAVSEFINYVCISTFIPPGSILHITGTREIYNISLARMILNFLGKPADLIDHVKDRPGHDKRYSLGRGRSTEDFGCPQYNDEKFDSDLQGTVEYYREKYQ